MKASPSLPICSAKAQIAGTTGAEGCPPIVLLQSSKSRTCEAMPLMSAALGASVRRSERGTDLHLLLSSKPAQGRHRQDAYDDEHKGYGRRQFEGTVVHEIED